MRKVGKETVGFGDRDKKREGVTRLIKTILPIKTPDFTSSKFYF
jgi:hypothetical protein